MQHETIQENGQSTTIRNRLLPEILDEIRDSGIEPAEGRELRARIFKVYVKKEYVISYYNPFG